MKVIIQTLLWKRPEISRIHFDNLKETGLDVYVGVSEDWAEDLCKEYGFKYVRVENHPLGAKKNATIDLALKDEWDYLLEMGSDDLIFNVKDYLKHCGEYDCFGTKGFYVACVRSKKAGYFKYKTNNLIGAGRVFSRRVLKRKLWEDDINRGLDGSSIRTFLKLGYSFKIIDDVVICDFKTDTNMNSMQGLIDKGALYYKEVGYDMILNKFPNQKDMINAIRLDS
jgi:hypothetical protein